MIRRLLLIVAGVVVLIVGAAVVAAVLLGRGRLDAMDLAAGPPTASPGNYEVALRYDERDRTYYVHVPPGATGGRPFALVLALHGGGGRARQMDDLTHLNAVADREGFLVVYPQGVDRNWNDGRPDSGSRAQKENIDDVGFIRSVIDDVSGRLPVDAAKVFATGISNGAIMSTRLACEAADRIAAVALVVGTAPRGFEEACTPGRPVPFMAFVSLDDPLVPYKGGDITALFNFIKRGKVVSADALEAFWTANNGCEGSPVAVALPDKTLADKSIASRIVHDACRNGGDVIFYRLDGAGHTWPGGKQYLSPWLVGTTNRDIDATELIWQFFASHSRR